MNILGISRSPRFSPNSAERDRAIFEAVCQQLQAAGHTVTSLCEDDLGGTAFTTDPHACFSMARDTQVLRALSRLEQQGCRVVNSPTALLAATRSALTRLFRQHGIPQPHTLSLAENERLDTRPLRRITTFPLWLKRGDAAAQSAGDVRYIRSATELQEALLDFKRKHITDAVLSRHLAGDLIKFYGVGGTDFFYFYYPTRESSFSKFGLERYNGQPEGFPFDTQDLKQTAHKAARLSGIHVYGGDAIVTADGHFHLIDFNDWPSFARCRDAAAEAIASLLLHPAASDTSIHTNDHPSPTLTPHVRQ